MGGFEFASNIIGAWMSAHLNIALSKRVWLNKHTKSANALLSSLQLGPAGSNRFEFANIQARERWRTFWGMQRF